MNDKMPRVLLNLSRSNEDHPKSYRVLLQIFLMLKHCLQDLFNHFSNTPAHLQTTVDPQNTFIISVKPFLRRIQSMYGVKQFPLLKCTDPPNLNAL